MPQVRTTAFGSRSYMAVSIVTDTNAPTAVSLAFLPSIDRVRKARLVFDDAGADGFEIIIEFQDDTFEEFTVAGRPRNLPQEEP